MKRLLTFALTSSALMFGLSLTAAAQIDQGVTFTTSSPFYVGNEKMPAGAYRISQPDADADELLVQSNDGKYSAFVEFTPTKSEHPHAHTDVTFQKHQGAQYLDRVWINGQRFGMKVEPSKGELKATTVASVVQLRVAGN